MLCSKIWHVGRVVHVNKYWLRHLNSLIFGFLWQDGANNTDRVNRLTTVQPVSKGGLAVPCIYSKLQAFDVIHIVNLLFSESEAKWKHLAVFFAGQALRKWRPAFASNLIPHSGVIPPFYTEVLTNFKIMFCESMGEDMGALRVSSTRGVYGKFLARKNVVPLVEQKLLGRSFNFPVIWANVFNKFVSPDLRCLGWRVVHGVLPVREKLHRQRSCISALCPLCRVGVETPQHIFLECPVVRPFLNRVEGIVGSLLNSPGSSLSEKEVIYLLLPPCSRDVKCVLLEVIGLFKYCVWKGRNEVEKEGKSRSGADMLNSFLALLKFREKVDLYRFTAEMFRKYWAVNNTIFQERNQEFLFRLAP